MRRISKQVCISSPLVGSKPGEHCLPKAHNLALVWPSPQILIRNHLQRRMRIVSVVEPWRIHCNPLYNHMFWRNCRLDLSLDVAQQRLLKSADCLHKRLSSLCHTFCWDLQPWCIQLLHVLICRMPLQPQGLVHCQKLLPPCHFEHGWWTSSRLAHSLSIALLERSICHVAQPNIHSRKNYKRTFFARFHDEKIALNCWVSTLCTPFKVKDMKMIICLCPAHHTKLAPWLIRCVCVCVCVKWCRFLFLSVG